MTFLFFTKLVWAAGYYGYSWGPSNSKNNLKSASNSSKAVPISPSMTPTANSTPTPANTNSSNNQVPKDLLELDYLIKASLIANNNCLQVGSIRSPSVEAWFNATKAYDLADKKRIEALNWLQENLKSKSSKAKIDQWNSLIYSIESLNIQLASIRGDLQYDTNDKNDEITYKVQLNVNASEKITKKLNDDLTKIINDLSIEDQKITTAFSSCESKIDLSKKSVCPQLPPGGTPSTLCTDISNFNDNDIKSLLLLPWRQEIVNDTPKDTTSINSFNQQQISEFNSKIITASYGPNNDWKTPLIECKDELTAKLKDDELNCNSLTSSALVLEVNDAKLKNNYKDPDEAGKQISDNYESANKKLGKISLRSDYFNSIQNDLNNFLFSYGKRYEYIDGQDQSKKLYEKFYFIDKKDKKTKIKLDDK